MSFKEFVKRKSRETQKMVMKDQLIKINAIADFCASHPEIFMECFKELPETSQNTLSALFSCGKEREVRDLTRYILVVANCASDNIKIANHENTERTLLERQLISHIKWMTEESLRVVSDNWRRIELANAIDELKSAERA